MMIAVSLDGGARDPCTRLPCSASATMDAGLTVVNLLCVDLELLIRVEPVVQKPRIAGKRSKPMPSPTTSHTTSGA